MNTFSERLREGLEARSLTQADLARLTGLHTSSISQYVTGRCDAKQAALYKIARALNVSEAWLMGYDAPALSEPINKTNKKLDKLVKKLDRLDAEDFQEVEAIVDLKLEKEKYKKSEAV